MRLALTARAPLAAPSTCTPTLPRVPRPRTRCPLPSSTIARRTLQNWQSIPHVFVTLDVDMGAALALRKQVNEGLPKEAQISVNDLVLKASATALVACPQPARSANASARAATTARAWACSQPLARC